MAHKCLSSHSSIDSPARELGLPDAFRFCGVRGLWGVMLIFGGSFSDRRIPSCENGFAAGVDLDELEMPICGLGVSVGVGVGALGSVAVGSELDISAGELAGAGVALPSFASRLFRIYKSQLGYARAGVVGNTLSASDIESDMIVRLSVYEMQG